VLAIAFVAERSPSAGDRHDRGVAVALVCGAPPPTIASTESARSLARTLEH